MKILFVCTSSLVSIGPAWPWRLVVTLPLTLMFVGSIVDKHSYGELVFVQCLDVKYVPNLCRFRPPVLIVDCLIKIFMEWAISTLSVFIYFRRFIYIFSVIVDVFELWLPLLETYCRFSNKSLFICLDMICTCLLCFIIIFCVVVTILLCDCITVK